MLAASHSDFSSLAHAQALPSRAHGIVLVARHTRTPARPPTYAAFPEARERRSGQALRPVLPHPLLSDYDYDWLCFTYFTLDADHLPATDHQQ